MSSPKAAFAKAHAGRNSRGITSESTPRCGPYRRVYNNMNETPHDATHSQRASINLDKILHGSRKYSSARNLEVNLPDLVPASRCTSPPPRRLSLPSACTGHTHSYDGSETASVSYGSLSICPKLLPSSYDSPHRTTTRRRRVSNDNADGNGVRAPSSVRRFSNRPPNSPHRVSIDRNRRRSMREQSAVDKPQSLLEMHLARSPRRSREAQENVHLIEACLAVTEFQRPPLQTTNRNRPRQCNSPARSRYSKSESRTQMPGSPASACRPGFKSRASDQRIADLPFAPLDF
jgi:hypothetical protein